MDYLFENDKYRYYRDFFEDHELILLEFKEKPGEFLFSAESFAHIMGYKSMEEMFSSDAFLDKVNEYMKSTGMPFPFIEL